MQQLEKNVTIQAHDLATFAKAVADKTKIGYELDLETNEGYPQMLGVNLFICGMKLKLDVTDVEEVVNTGVQQQLELPLEEPAKPAFKPKTKK